MSGDAGEPEGGRADERATGGAENEREDATMVPRPGRAGSPSPAARRPGAATATAGPCTDPGSSPRVRLARIWVAAS